MIRFLGLLSLLSCNVEVEKENEKIAVDIQRVVNYGNRGLKRSYESSVKINVFATGEHYGSGSGNYFIYGGKKFILTAAHVVEDTDYIEAQERYGIESVVCKVVYKNDYYDIAVLVPEADFKTLKPIKYNYYYNMKRGEPVYFTGYPSELEEITSFGYVSGQFNEFFVVQSVAWLGSSGSVVFNSRGKVVGIVSGVKVGMSPIGIPQIVNNIVMVTPIHFLNERLLRDVLNDRGN